MNFLFVRRKLYTAGVFRDVMPTCTTNAILKTLLLTLVLRMMLPLLSTGRVNSNFTQDQFQGAVADPKVFHDQLEFAFVTFAYPSSKIGRWNNRTTCRAVRLLFATLMRSQKKKPFTLHIFTDSNILRSEFTGYHMRVVVHFKSMQTFKKNPYAAQPWQSLSRSKLDAVEELLHQHDHVIWIDLDTLLFADLTEASATWFPWVIGYQHGGCDGKHVCSDYGTLEPRYDALGDLWSLDLTAIEEVRRYENHLIRNNKTLPPYDLQSYFSKMLQNGSTSLLLLHDKLPLNFGFFCSNFRHPNSLRDLDLYVSNGTLHCPKRHLVSMGTEVGAISFTAPTFSSLFNRNGTLNFQMLRNISVREYFSQFFLDAKF